MRQLAALLVMSALVFSAQVADGGPVHSGDVDYRADGSVRVGSDVFATREAYHQSALFQASGARCGTPPRGPDVMELISPNDCGGNSTTINQDYNDNRTLVVPVVFHVIKRTDGTGNITPALIQSQVDILNEDFNALAGTPGAMGTNSKIQFVLAKLDPAGNPTTGINVVTNNTYFNDPGGSGTNYMKRALKWDTARYLNIYTNNGGGSGILGYATFPSDEAGGPEDGVVLNWVYVGRNAPGGEPYDQGRTATHEVGHYLGLYHTFQSGCGSSTAPFTSGDLIGDTAREAQPNYGCTPVASGCGGMSPIENYMDYSADACMTKFTAQQVNRMRCSIVNFRWINTPPTAAFTYVASGLEATFTSTSTDAQSPATALKYNWSFGDGATSTMQNPVHAYSAGGTYNVTLEVLDPGSGTGTATQSLIVTVSSQPDAGASGGDDAGVNGDAGLGSNGETPGGESGGCCEARGNGTSAVLCGLPVLFLVARRRRRRLAK
ncbi:MAG TPA: M43 family zinc metalloprotease [Kofleriaceae bacterium]